MAVGLLSSQLEGWGADRTSSRGWGRLLLEQGSALLRAGVGVCRRAARPGWKQPEPPPAKSTRRTGRSLSSGPTQEDDGIPSS